MSLWVTIPELFPFNTRLFAVHHFELTCTKVASNMQPIL